MRRRLEPESVKGEVEAARELFQRGHPARSRRRFRSLLVKLDGVPVEDEVVATSRARLLLGLAAAEFEVTGDFDEAMRLLRRSEREAGEAGADWLTASIHGQRGLLHLRKGETVQALRSLDEAIAWLDSAPDYDKMTLLLNRGALHMERGSLDEAAADLTRCIEIAGAGGEVLLTYKAMHNLGYVEFLAGRLPRALRALEEAERINPTGDSPIAMLDRARVLREAGLTREGDELLSRVAGILLDARLFQDLAETEMVRAECALVDGDPAGARVLASAARRRFARRSNLRWQRRAELLILRCDRFLIHDKKPGRQRPALRAIAVRAAELSESCRREGRRDLARDARLLAHECSLRAGDESTGGLPSLRGVDTLQSRLHAREVRALEAASHDEHRRALAEVCRGLAELGDYQHSFGSLDLRTASAVYGSALARLGVDVALRTGSPAAVLNLVEKARAVSTRLPQVRPPSDERTAGLLSDLRRVEEEARALEGDPSAGDRLEGLRLRAGQLQRDIRARAWEIEGRSGSAEAAPRLGAVGDAAREQGVEFVTFARHQGRWVAVPVHRGRGRIVELAPVSEVGGLVSRARADLDALAMTALPPPLRAAVRRSLELTLGQLDRVLVEPLRLGDRPAVLSCSGDLVFLPWGLLPSRRGVSTVVTPSASAWLAGCSGRRPSRPRALAVAGPDLRRAAEEADLVAQVWTGGRAVSGVSATAAAAREGLVSADLVHVAAHGTHRQDNPLFSSVRMADGPFYAYEIDPAAGALAGCVVLSACEAGLSTLRPGDESLGLAHVLLQLGTRSVIAGVARVGDDESACLMERVHRDMAAGKDAASALAEAQRVTLDGESPAAFVSFGATW